MIYPFTLKSMMLVVGFLLTITHLIALVRMVETQRWLKKFPRSAGAGIFLMIAGGAWFFWLVTNMDLGEFTPMKGTLQVAGPVVTFLAIFYMKEFLAVRAWGIIGLLAAEPLLESAFLREEKIRL